MKQEIATGRTSSVTEVVKEAIKKPETVRPMEATVFTMDSITLEFGKLTRNRDGEIFSWRLESHYHHGEREMKYHVLNEERYFGYSEDEFYERFMIRTKSLILRAFDRETGFTHTFNVGTRPIIFGYDVSYYSDYFEHIREKYKSFLDDNEVNALCESIKELTEIKKLTIFDYEGIRNKLRCKFEARKNLELSISDLSKPIPEWNIM